MSYGNLMAHWMLDEIIENDGISACTVPMDPFKPKIYL